MILSGIILIAKVLGYFLVAILGITAYHHFRAISKIKRFKAQGMYADPKTETFFIGTMGQLIEYFGLVKANPKTILPQFWRWYVD